VRCILDSLEEFTPAEEADNTQNDALLQSYMCPITREILVEPVSLPCGHSFSRIALDLALKAGSQRRCPVCKNVVPSGDLQVAENVEKHSD
jgi:hypothetical protein